MLISGKDNPRLKRLAKLCKSSSFRRSEGEFVIEGLRGCADAVRSFSEGLVEITGFYYQSSAFSGSSYVVYEQFDSIPDDRRFELSEGLADKVSDMKSSQGVFMTAKRTARPLSELDSGKTPKILVLDAVKDPGNVGTLLRTADAVGIKAAVLTGECADVFSPKVVRSTVGSLLRLGIFIENDFENVCKALKAQDMRVCAAVVRGGEKLPGFVFPEKCAVVIGNEARGLSDADTGLCTDRITINMKGRAESLNAATAGSIIMWEMQRG